MKGLILATVIAVHRASAFLGTQDPASLAAFIITTYGLVQ